MNNKPLRIAALVLAGDCCAWMPFMGAGYWARGTSRALTAKPGFPGRAKDPVLLRRHESATPLRQARQSARRYGLGAAIR